MLYGNLSGLENLEYFARLGGHGEYSAADYRAFLDRVGLQPEAASRRNRRPAATRSGQH
jgi:ABC-2 type transport system ATP-binding protein